MDTGCCPITDMVPGSVKGSPSRRGGHGCGPGHSDGTGINLSDLEDMGGVLYSYFSDPDGNMWALQQWPAGHRT